MKVGTKIIGRNQPVFIIAEAGINHNGSLKLAKRLIEKAKEAGADAVKFQTFNPESLCSQRSQYFKLFKSLQIAMTDWMEMAEFARKTGIIFLSTPFDEQSVDLLYSLGVPAFKIASGDLTYLPFLKYIARKNKPVLLSTGASEKSEIREALKTIYSTGNRKVILLHCVSNYPARAEDVNLKVIDALAQEFNIPVGFSDHTTDITIPIIAAYLGARVIEKHFTLDKNLNGPDHKLSLEPKEFKGMVTQIRIIKEVSGDGKKKPCSSEKKIKDLLRRSIIAKCNIPKGTVISKEMLKISRPGTGIEPKFLEKVISKVARQDIDEDEVLHWGKLY